jgi:hypothetical protein
MARDQQGAGSHDSKRVLQEGRDKHVADRETPDGPDHAAEQHRVDDEIGEACGATDKDLVE